MRKPLLAVLMILWIAGAVAAADSVVGLWRGVDENTGESTMFTCIYEYQGKLYGRMVLTFDAGVPKDMINGKGDLAEMWKGNPQYAGMDIIWGLEDRGNRWKRGKICDPKEGKIYDSEIWRDGENLIVRGKIGPFGRNQTWQPVAPEEIPAGLDYGNPRNWTPVIPELK